MGGIRSSVFDGRAKQFAVDVICLTRSLPPALANEVLIKQLIRSATSVGANHRAAFRSRSNAEAVSKLGIVEEEADECKWWLELLVATNGPLPEADRLNQEADELLAMTIAAIRTIRGRARK